MADAKQEELVRNSIKDVIVVVKKMVPVCKSPEELVDLLELALVNDGQLALVMNQIGPIQLKK